MVTYSNMNTIDRQIFQNQAQVNDLTNIMHENINKVMERDINLTILDERTDNLNNQASDFRNTARDTKKFYICKNRKWTIILIVTVLIILAVIGLIIGLAVGLTKKN